MCFAGKVEKRQRGSEAETKELYAKIGELTVEKDFFVQSARSLSVKARRATIEPKHPRLSIRRQCRLMSLNRSTLYYEPKGESEENLQLMRRLDEQFLKTPYYGSRQMVYHLKRRGSRVGRKRVRRLMAKMGPGGHLSKAADFTASPGESSISVSSSRIGGHPARSGVVHGCHLHPDASGLFVPGGDHGLVQPLGFVLEAVEHAGAVLFVAKHSRKRSTGTIPRRSSIQTRGVSSPARSSRDYSKGPGCVSRWTGEAAGWTTSSSSVCGVHSNTNASI